MPKVAKARVFMSGRSQHVTIPAEFRFFGGEVYIRRDPHTGDIILSERSGNLAEVFAKLDELGVPESFLSPSEREQDPPQEREQ